MTLGKPLIYFSLGDDAHENLIQFAPLLSSTTTNKLSCTSKSECHSSASVFEIRESPAVAVVGATGRQQQQSTTGGGAVPMESAAAAAKSQLKWISSSEAAGKCIDLQSIVPDKIASTSTDKVSYPRPLSAERISSAPLVVVVVVSLHSSGEGSLERAAMLISRLSSGFGARAFLAELKL